MIFLASARLRLPKIRENRHLRSDINPEPSDPGERLLVQVRVQVPEMSDQTSRGQADHLEVFSAHAHKPANSRGGLASNSRFGPDRAVNSRSARSQA